MSNHKKDTTLSSSQKLELLHTLMDVSQLLTTLCDPILGPIQSSLISSNQSPRVSTLLEDVRRLIQELDDREDFGFNDGIQCDN